MNSFKDIAYQILKEIGKPLHSKEITKIALDKGWLVTAGKTPEATMNAQLVVDINSKKDKSRFIKTGPSIFGLNENVAIPEIIKVIKEEKVYRITVDKFETAMQRANQDMGYIIAFSFGKDAYEEVARAQKDGLFIDLLTVDKLL